MFQLGSVFRWDNFPDVRDTPSKPKPRWFVYLGRSGVLLVPVFLYICTTTGKISEYESGGIRASNLFIKFHTGEYGFAKDCVLDIDMNFYEDITKERITACISDIEIIDILSEEALRRIYNKLILKTNAISLVIKKDIHQSYNMAEITNLKKPRA